MTGRARAAIDHALLQELGRDVFDAIAQENNPAEGQLLRRLTLTQRSQIRHEARAVVARAREEKGWTSSTA